MAVNYVTGVLQAFESLKAEFEKRVNEKDLVCALHVPVMPGGGAYWHIGRRKILKSELCVPSARGSQADYYPHTIAHIGLTPVPACCGAYLLHGASVYQNFVGEGVDVGNYYAVAEYNKRFKRVGFGKLLLELGLRAAYISGYSLIQAITNDRMEWAENILKKGDFSLEYKVTSRRTNRELRHWYRDISKWKCPIYENQYNIIDKEAMTVAQSARLGY